MFIVKPSRFPGIKLVYKFFVIGVKEKKLNIQDSRFDNIFIRFENIRSYSCFSIIPKSLYEITEFIKISSIRVSS